MQRKYWFIIAVLVGILQISVPLWMIWNKEQTIKKGNTFLFQIAPIDPTHPLKGKYIILDYLPLELKVQKPLDLNQPTYATLSKDEKNHFKITHLSHTLPSYTTDYVEVHANQWYLSDRKKTDTLIYNIQFPFNEFYMEENKAPKAESIYIEMARDSSFKAYAVVKIYKGDAVITDVLMNGKSIYEWIE